MTNLIDYIETQIRQILTKNELKGECKIIKCKLPKYDYSLNNSFAISKENNLSPNDFYNILKKNISDDSGIDIFFDKNHINICLQKKYVIKIAENILLNDHNNHQSSPQKIIVDYSSPNVAKDMHVGHLRSTIIGDAIANFYEKLGHNVMRINHIGDFGLPFGMMIQYVIINGLSNDIEKINLQEIYKKSRELYDNDEEFKKESYQRTLELQKKTNDNTIKIWRSICDISKKSYDVIYDKLDIKLIERGESFYNFMFDNLVDELKSNNLLEFDNGRYIIPVKMSDGTTIPLTIIKSDGGYTYDTTDLCALKHRLEVEKADKVFYVVDSGQSAHFQQIFNVAQTIGWKKDNHNLYHINFGVVLGSDKKRLKSRNGCNPKLIDLLNESVEKTKNVYKQKNGDDIPSDDYIENIAYGSLKYFDLSLNRTLDYVFSYDNMINFKGNTLIFVMYAYVRCNSIFKNVEKFGNPDNHKYIKCDELTDKDMYLLKNILRLPEIIQQIFNSHYFHLLCDYLCQLSEIIHGSYNVLRCVDFIMNENKEIVGAKNINYSRTNIFRLCIKKMNFCFDILGVKPVNHM